MTKLVLSRHMNCCARKVPYWDGGDATQTLRHLQRAGREGLVKYRCSACGAWHLGRKKGGAPCP